MKMTFHIFDSIRIHPIHKYGESSLVDFVEKNFLNKIHT